MGYTCLGDTEKGRGAGGAEPFHMHPRIYRTARSSRPDPGKEEGGARCPQDRAEGGRRLWLEPEWMGGSICGADPGVDSKASRQANWYVRPTAFYPVRSVSLRAF